MRTLLDEQMLLLQFCEDNSISIHEVQRVSKLLCMCKQCKHFVQHYDMSGERVEFGHCARKSTNLQSQRPNHSGCGFWEGK